jgi:hypothetical protein
MADSMLLPASVPVEAAVAAAPSLRAYPRRWLVLALFVLYSTSNAFQWTQLVIITSILERYYEVSTIAISWTSMIYMVTYIPLIFPASWFLQKKVSEKSSLKISYERRVSLPPFCVIVVELKSLRGRKRFLIISRQVIVWSLRKVQRVHVDLCLIFPLRLGKFHFT